MKTIDYYMDLPYRLEIVPDSAEGGYVAAYPELPGCITVGDTLEETVAHVLDVRAVQAQNTKKSSPFPCRAF